MIGRIATYQINIRPSYAERAARYSTLALNGTILKLRTMWYMGEDELYPGEYALVPAEKEDRDRLWENGQIIWIASGDVVEVKE